MFSDGVCHGYIQGVDDAGRLLDEDTNKRQWVGGWSALDDHVPALRSQQCRDPSIAIAAILGCQRNDRSRHGRFVVTQGRTQTLRRTMLANHLARPTLRYRKPDLYVINRIPVACGA